VAFYHNDVKTRRVNRTYPYRNPHWNY